MDQVSGETTGQRNFLEFDEEESGWPIFIGIITALLGVFNLIEGLLTLFSDRYGGAISEAVFFFSRTGWGLLHVLLGLLLLGVGGALLAQVEWAPAAAVGLAAATAIFQMIYVNLNPSWSWVNVALSVLIIYVLVVKGRDALGIIASYRAGPWFPLIEEDEERKKEGPELDRP